MTDERALLFIELLEEVRRDGFFINELALPAVRGTFCEWAPELVVVKENQILLGIYEHEWGGMIWDPRTGERRRGTGEKCWHLPGGYAKWSDTNRAAVCNRISEREIGVQVGILGTIGTYWWKPGEHHNPEARPLSVYMAVQPLGPIAETETLRFFSTEELPIPIIGGSHKHFLARRKYYLRRMKAPGFLELG